MAIEKVRRNGPYAPLSATYFQDDDIAEAGEAAELLFLRGLAFCAGRPNSDGFISNSQAHRYVAVGMTNVSERIARLVETGLWEEQSGGYQIRAWLKWNKSAEELGIERAKDRDRKRVSAVAQPSEPFRAERGAEGVAEEERSENRNPPGGGADSERKEDVDNVESLNGGNSDIAGQNLDDFPLGIRSASATHVTSPHVTSQHSLAPAARSASESETLFDQVPTPVPKRTRKPREIPDDPDFIAFYDCYPRKVGRESARRAWAAKIAKGVEPRAILDGVQRYRTWPGRPTEMKYIPHPATWLNGERWNDEMGARETVPVNGSKVRPWWQE